MNLNSNLMKINGIWHSLGALSCGSLATYISIRMLDQRQAHTIQRQLEEQPSKGIWYHDWDRRQKLACNVIDQSDGEKGAKSAALRHIVLVRHGEYRSSPDGCHLTDLGRLQAHRTGQRLHDMGIAWDHVVASTMTRAQETAMIILKQINFDPLKMRRCELLPEGTPCPANPPQNRDICSVEKACRRDGPRIEAAFRRYFFRASPEQKNDSHMLIIGHANVIRYLVCRALQFPPEAWTRFTLNHGSITWLTVWPSGYVTLRYLSDTGFMPAQELTYRRPKTKLLLQP